MRSFNNKNLWYVILALVIALLWIIFRPITPGVKLKPIEVVKVDTRGYDSLMIEIHQYRDTVLAMRARESAANKKLKESAGRIRDLGAKYEAAKADKDTPSALVACDSVVSENNVLLTIIDEQQEARAAADSARDVQDLRKDSVIARGAAITAEYHSLYRSAVDSANVARAQVNKLTRQKKREKTATRILAIGVLVLGGLLIVK